MRISVVVDGEILSTAEAERQRKSADGRTINDLIDRFEKTGECRIRTAYLNFWRDELGDKLVDEITRADFLAYDWTLLPPECVSDADVCACGAGASGFEAYPIWDDEPDPLAGECLQVMTIYGAKGLEFDTVFLCGLEEGLFPHRRSVDEPGRLEEERRLCYVGITRAGKRLLLSYAEHRRLHGSESYCMPSRFINEIPADLVEEIRPRIHISRPYVSHAGRQPLEPQAQGLGLGQRVQHAKFGDGVVLNYEGQGAHARVQVNFESAGTKWLVVAYANLQPA